MVFRFGDAVGVDGEEIACAELNLLGAARPVVEQTNHRCRGRQSLHRSISLHDETRKMTAVRVSQSARAIVELRVEQRGIGVVGGILVEQPVYRLKQLFRLLSLRALTAQVGLKV